MTVTAEGNGLISEPILGTPADCKITHARNSFTSVATTAGFLPGTIKFLCPLVGLALREFASQRGIQLAEVDQLPSIDNFLHSMHGLADMPSRMTGLPPEAIADILGRRGDETPPV